MDVVKRFLGSYSESFMLALGIWPALSFVLTLPILAWLYHRDGRIRFTTAVAAYLVVLYVLGLGCFTLYPMPSGTEGLGITYGVPPQTNPLAFVDDLAREGISALPQMLANVVFFVPLGFICGRLFRWGIARSVLCGFIVSLLLETAQLTGFFGLYAYAYRTFDVDDLAYNTLGALAGWGCAYALGRVLPPGALADEDEVTTSPGFVRRCVALWLDALVVLLVSTVASFAFSLIFELVRVLQEMLRFGAPIVGVDAVYPPSFPDSGYVVLLVVAYVAFEFVVPLLHEGRTFGGSFVRMTCETRERTGLRRVVFLAARLVTIALAFEFCFVVFPLLAVFYAVARRMPYDYL